MIEVELIYHRADQTLIRYQLSVSEKSSVSDVLNSSGIMNDHPETKQLSYGIFGKKVSEATAVTSGDRIEIYRPLMLDPK